MRKILFIFCIFFCSISFAENNTKPYWIRNWGIQSCGSYISSDDVQKLAMDSYASGFLTGFNASNSLSKTKFSSKVGDKVDEQGIQMWLKNYCNQFPTDRFSNAIFNLYLELSRNNQ